MIYTGYELLWIYLIYSFIGWCGEVAVAAVTRHKFINRGFVNGPLCPIYGAGAVAFAVFLPELEHHIFFLFLGGLILASFIEYMTGRLMEKIFHKKWWDYSNERFHIEGYVCLKTSVIWGLCAVVSIKFLNPLLYSLISLIPELAGMIIVWAAAVLLGIDTAGSSIAILGLKKNKRISQITAELHKTSKLLENALTLRIQNRMLKAFPEIEPAAAEEKEKVKPERFAEGCSFYKLVSLFFIGAFLGDIVETIFCLATSGELMSRSSVVYGPFSIVWGLACGLLTAILYKYRDKSDRYIFIFGTVLGGAYEYICSVFTELVFGTVFWDYSDFAFNLGGRINLLYCFFWGIAAVIWMKAVYPVLSGWIEKLPMRAGKILCNLMIVFMIINILMSGLALGRYSERQTGKIQQTAVGQFFDEHFPDERMERIYPNAKVTK
ncbi:hypothetical protein GCM10008910_13590 [Faecalicatena orotica]|uniref:Putative ABC transporter type IV n=1 Tax=Faecalicatena orotica TaxID=1544 RepID=A0A2Y9BAY8_9FIRM|nr:putative ABC transporter permease [Faecalicatena orotica]PWJ31403.1 putative ABC transporter type IV [Faecalicatena orotica]SSA54609.1 Putative ABC-transporter type IV [Faecalicatena orotica]